MRSIEPGTSRSLMRNCAPEVRCCASPRDDGYAVISSPAGKREASSGCNAWPSTVAISL
jgi:hypothetical protein